MDTSMLIGYGSGDLNEDAKTLLSNYFAADDAARSAMLLTSEGFVKHRPNKDTALRFLPVTWRPKVLKFFVFR